MFNRLTDARMKTIWLWITALLIGWSEGHAQLVLKGGESYTYRFDSLPFQRNTTFGIAGPSGTLFAYIDPWDPWGLGPTNSYRVELFEDTPVGVPILSRTITSASSIYDTDYRTANAWADLQGSIRVTALSGFITLQGFSLQAFKTSAAGGFDVYGTDRIYLPAPPVLSMIASNAFAIVRWTTSATNFVLEASSSMAPLAPWQAVTNAVISTGNVFSVSLALDESHRFFRLRGGP
jgi:hypothetical protein